LWRWEGYVKTCGKEEEFRKVRWIKLAHNKLNSMTFTNLHVMTGEEIDKV
jgi:hypothetical protein